MGKPVEQEGRGPDGRFLPGFSGNPQGRPPGSSIQHWLQKKLDDPSNVEGVSRGELIAAILVGMAEAGHMPAIDAILRRFAPEKLAVELSGPDKSAIPVEWVGDADRKLDQLLEGQSAEEVLEKLQ